MVWSNGVAVQRDFMLLLLDKMNYLDVIILTILFAIFFLFYMDYDIMQKLTHLKYVIVIVSLIGFFGYIRHRINQLSSIPSTNKKRHQGYVNNDFDSVLLAIEPLKVIDIDTYNSLVNNIKKFVAIYEKTMDQNPNNYCTKPGPPTPSEQPIVWDNVKQAKKYKNRIMKNMHSFPTSETYNAKLNYHIQQMEITLNAYLRAIIRECNIKAEKKDPSGTETIRNRSLLTSDVMNPPKPSMPEGYY